MYVLCYAKKHVMLDLVQFCFKYMLVYFKVVAQFSRKKFFKYVNQLHRTLV